MGIAAKPDGSRHSAENFVAKVSTIGLYAGGAIIGSYNRTLEGLALPTPAFIGTRPYGRRVVLFVSVRTIERQRDLVPPLQFTADVD